MAASESHKREFTLCGCAKSMYFLLMDLAEYHTEATFGGVL